MPDDGPERSAPTLVERERILRDATRRYLIGEIDYHELTAIRLRLDRPSPSEGTVDAGGPAGGEGT